MSWGRQSKYMGSALRRLGVRCVLLGGGMTRRGHWAAVEVDLPGAGAHLRHSEQGSARGGAGVPVLGQMATLGGERAFPRACSPATA